MLYNYARMWLVCLFSSFPLPCWGLCVAAEETPPPLPTRTNFPDERDLGAISPCARYISLAANSCCTCVRFPATLHPAPSG
jgi:hypothetical protein